AIDGINITAFRSFHHLVLHDTGQINLIVGKNNTGKTSLLEALNIFFSQGSRSSISDALRNREEFSFTRIRQRALTPRDMSLAYESLFFGRPHFTGRPSFEIRSTSSRKRLRVSFTWLQEIREETPDGVVLRTIAAPDDISQAELIPGLSIVFGEKQSLVTL